MIHIDARGLRCPWPALRLARALREGAGTVEVLADDPVAPGELAAVATAHGLVVEQLGQDRFRVAATNAVNPLFTAVR
ncbi:sulfurtransferase TusA family protein [Sphingomonas sp.]|uniref:sulfurtransferase TusA family protein n=1 Tax=Sphingomonas sp. TaxID=28214 RepID=UPI002DD666AE|nr:sulfurtransferase TusA family protein [Sphingomonas sp.]